MDICVIGDSHAVALKDAYPAMEGEFPGCGVTFFAGYGDRLKALTVTDGKLTANSPDLLRLFKLTSGGEASIEPRYDAYLLVGVGFRLFRAARLCQSEIEKRLNAGADPKIADDELVCLIHKEFTLTIGNAVMAKLRQVTDAPAYFVATPYPGLTVDREIWRWLKRRIPLDRLESAYNAACEKLCAAQDVRFLPQPDETIARNGVTTREKYTRGATAVVERVSDDRHMNAEFGAIVLRAALRAIIAPQKLEN
ncbi:MAG TPA: hypothetical protein VMF58_13700 [Rhizomicrobium sp.]|nr:hypothetical protein [Rhizomicrobium sp.]